MGSGFVCYLQAFCNYDECRNAQMLRDTNEWKKRLVSDAKCRVFSSKERQQVSFAGLDLHISRVITFERKSFTHNAKPTIVSTVHTVASDSDPGIPQTIASVFVSNLTSTLDCGLRFIDVVLYGCAVFNFYLLMRSNFYVSLARSIAKS